jgi:hypothetical protein
MISRSSPKNPITSISRTAWCALATVALAFLFIFGEPLFTSATFFPPADDAPFFRHDTQWSSLQFLWGAWGDNAMGQGYGGSPLVPTTLLSILLPPLVFHLLRYILDTVLLGLATAFFLRGRGFRGVIQWLPAVGLALSGYMFTLISAGHAGFFDMMPLAVFLFCSVDRGFRLRSVFWFAWAGACAAFGIARQPDVMALFALLAAIYSGFLFFENRPIQGTVRAWSKYLGTLVIGFVGAVAIFAVVGASIFTGSAQALETREGVRGQTPQEQWEFATNWSMPPEEMLDMVAPFVYGIETGDPAGPYWGRLGRSIGWRQTRQGLMNLKQHTLYMGLIPLIFGLYAFVWALIGKRPRLFNGGTTSVSSAGFPQQKPGHAVRYEIWFWSAAFLLTVILAMGRYTPVYRLFYALPFFSKIRAPVKFIHLSEWALAVLFAYGLAIFLRDVGRVFGGQEKAACSESPPNHAERDMEHSAMLNHGEHGAHGKNARKSACGSGKEAKRGNEERAVVRRWLIGFGIGCAALGLVFLFAAGIVPGFEPLRTYWTDLGFAQHIDLLARTMRGGLLRAMTLSFVAAGVFVLPLFSKKAVVLTVIGVLWIAVLTDMATVGRRYVRVGDVSPWYNRNPVAERILSDPQPGRTAFYLGHSTWRNWVYGSLAHHNIDMLQTSTGDFAPPLEYQRFFHASQKNPFRLWEITNTRYIMGAREQIAQLIGHPAFEEVMGFELDANRYVPVSTGGTYVLLEFKAAMPRASLVGDWEYVDPDEALLKMTDPQWNPRQKAWVSTSVPSPPSGVPVGSAQITRYGRTRIDVATEASAPALLLLKDKYDPDWRVTVNGEKADLLQCNYILRGVMVPAGISEVRFTYRPNLPWFLTSLAGVLVMLLWSGARMAQGRQLHRPAGPRLSGRSGQQFFKGKQFLSSNRAL